MAEAHTCPHCGASMDPIETPLESSWGGEVHYVCFNDRCTYYVSSWNTLEGQGIERAGYRCRVDPRGACGPIAVWSPTALKDLVLCVETATACEPFVPKGTADYFPADDFARDDETPDSVFYQTPRFVEPLDRVAATTVEDLYERLIPRGARVLDLMAGADSHLRAEFGLEGITGLGISSEELRANNALSDRVVHDLNADPHLPFDDNEFDAVVHTVSVEYLTRPIEVFREVSRVLRPNGRFVVVFSNRMFPPKAVRIWKRTDEAERVDLVKKFFELCEAFSVEDSFESRGKPRPEDDKYYSLGIPSDPIYALWAKPNK